MDDVKGYVTRLNGCELHFDPATVVLNIKCKKYILPRPKEFVEPENPNDRARKIAKSIKE